MISHNTHQKTRCGKADRPDTHWVGHGEKADRISNSLASRPIYHLPHVHLRKFTVGGDTDRRRVEKNRNNNRNEKEKMLCEKNMLKRRKRGKKHKGERK